MRHSTFNIQHSTFNIPVLTLLVLACSPTPKGQVVRDDLNRVVPIHSTSRIITLAPNLTELVFAINAGQKIIATDDFSDIPPAAKSLPKVGGLQPSVERIAQLKPDLVIATTNGNHPNLAPALAAVNIPLFVARTDRLDDIPRSMTRLGELIGIANANDAAQSLRRNIAAQRRARSRSPRVLFLVWGDPLYVAGRSTFTDDLLRLTDAQNAVSLTGWPQYSLEALAASPPDIILYPDRSVSRPQIDRVLAAVPAREKIALEPVDENLFTRPGPRVAEAASKLNAIVDRWESSVR